MKGLIFSLCLLAAVGSLVAQETFPQNDIDFKKVGTYAFVHATIIQNSHITLKDATLIVSIYIQITVCRRCPGLKTADLVVLVR